MEEAKRGWSGRRMARAELWGFTLLLLSYIWVWQGAFRGALWMVIALGLMLIVISHRAHGDGWRETGLRTDNFWRSMREVGAATSLALVFICGSGWLLGTNRPVPYWRWERLGWLLAWAFLQQFALQAFVQLRMRDLVGSKPRAALLAAALFAFFHLPNPPLMLSTFLIGWVWCRMFAREPNLFTLTLSHTILSIAMSHSFPRAWFHSMRVGPGYFNY